ncbi:hypothetical protein CRPA25_31680 [Pseudomonas aeruginosa]
MPGEHMAGLLAPEVTIQQLQQLATKLLLDLNIYVGLIASSTRTLRPRPFRNQQLARVDHPFHDSITQGSKINNLHGRSCVWLGDMPTADKKRIDVVVGKYSGQVEESDQGW